MKHSQDSLNFSITPDYDAESPPCKKARYKVHQNLRKKIWDGVGLELKKIRTTYRAVIKPKKMDQELRDRLWTLGII